jgi:hypothetical protein
VARYLLSKASLPGFAWDLLGKRRRSFREDARAWLAAQRAPVVINGREWIPSCGPALLTVNHYSRRGFQAWWLPLAISASIPAEVHWIMTAAWTSPDRSLSRQREAVSRWLLSRIAGTYGFTSMPPMPPRPGEEQERFRSVRAVLAYAQSTPQPLIGLSPEGRDNPAGGLFWPPAGVGRLILHLARLGLAVIPIGVYESGAALCLNFGRPASLDIAPGLAADERDRAACEAVMRRIAALLPEQLRGAFG